MFTLKLGLFVLLVASLGFPTFSYTANAEPVVCGIQLCSEYPGGYEAWKKDGLSNLYKIEKKTQPIEKSSTIKKVSAAEEYLELLFIQDAESAITVQHPGDDSNRYTITLNDVAKDTLYFSDRPNRLTGYMSTEDFAVMWHTGANSFSDDPPNTVIKFVSDGQSYVSIIELQTISYDESNNTLIYEIEVLDEIDLSHIRDAKAVNKLPEKMNDVTLFIDDVASTILGIIDPTGLLEDLYLYERYGSDGQGCAALWGFVEQHNLQNSDVAVNVLNCLTIANTCQDYYDKQMQIDAIKFGAAVLSFIAGPEIEAAAEVGIEAAEAAEVGGEAVAVGEEVAKAGTSTLKKVGSKLTNAWDKVPDHMQGIIKRGASKAASKLGGEISSEIFPNDNPPRIVKPENVSC